MKKMFLKCYEMRIGREIKHSKHLIPFIFRENPKSGFGER